MIIIIEGICRLYTMIIIIEGILQTIYHDYYNFKLKMDKAFFVHGGFGLS